MARNIILLVVICVLGYAGYYAWKNHEQKVKADSGDYTCTGCLSPEAEARFQKENSGDTADGSNEHKAAPSRVAAEDAVTGAPAPVGTAGGSTTPYPPAQGGFGSGSTTASAPVIVPTTPSQGSMSAGVPANLPMSDSVSPNPTNGERFAGSGNYQWYRQGNLTWRVDTASGRSCIIYATMEEWRKQIVMSHGCGRAA